MREKAFICDLCHTRVEETRWDLQARGLYLNIYLPSSNPMGAVSTNGNWQSSVIEYKEVCNECRKAVATQIAAAVKSRLELSEHRQKRDEQVVKQYPLPLAPADAEEIGWNELTPQEQVSLIRQGYRPPALTVMSNAAYTELEERGAT